jgi:hypothetical protein
MATRWCSTREFGGHARRYVGIRRLLCCGSVPKLEILFRCAHHFVGGDCIVLDWGCVAFDGSAMIKAQFHPLMWSDSWVTGAGSGRDEMFSLIQVFKPWRSPGIGIGSTF